MALTASVYPPRSVEVTIEADPPAERLRFRKGSLVYMTRGSERFEYRVTKVSMPNEFGRCIVTAELD